MVGGSWGLPAFKMQVLRQQGVLAGSVGLKGGASTSVWDKPSQIHLVRGGTVLDHLKVSELNLLSKTTPTSAWGLKYLSPQKSGRIHGKGEAYKGVSAFPVLRSSLSPSKVSQHLASVWYQRPAVP